MDYSIWELISNIDTTKKNRCEALPILYTTWINLPDEYKNASRPCEEDDLKNVNE
jgi:hypothetical protein